MEPKRQSGPAPRRAPSPAPHDEEETGRESTPRKDLLGAALVAAAALTVIVLSTGLDAPDRWYTAPGLLPLATAAALLAMAAALGARALRAGAARHLLGDLAAGLGSPGFSDEDRRTALLSALIVAYVVLVGRLGFELRIPAALFDVVLSGYELVSIVAITIVLRLFWRATWLRCCLVSVAGVELLAWAFRYGFHMIMPEAF